MTPLYADSPVPAHGSVVLRHGPTGTAYQRLYSTGLFHSSTGKPLTFKALFEGLNTPKGDSTARPCVLLVHDAALYEMEA